jgi:hypothetical protein
MPARCVFAGAEIPDRKRGEQVVGDAEGIRGPPAYARGSERVWRFGINQRRENGDG